MTASTAAALLAGRSVSLLCGIDDRDQVVAACTSSLRPHALLLGERSATLDTSLSSAPLATSSINRLRYGAPVVVLPAGPEEDTFLIVLPLSGTGQLEYGEQTVTARQEGLYVIGPYEPFRFAFAADYDQLVVRIPRRRVEQVAGVDGGAKARVNLPVNGTAALAACVHLLNGALTLPLQSERVPQMAAQIEELLVETLVLPYWENEQSAMPGTTYAQTVRAAKEYIRENLAETLSLTRVAAHCAVSLRTLQTAFRRELDTSPSAWIRSQRLELVHRALSQAHVDEVTVGEVAFDHGFVHLGDFSRQFKSRFGALPSSVLRDHA